MNKEQAALRAEQIKANNSAARDAVELAKAAQILPVIADQPVADEALAESQEAVKTARETLSHLHGQRIVAEARIADLAEQRKATAFQALSGDTAARQRLDECTCSTVTAGLELENIVSAIAEAEARVRQAEAAAARALEHQQARETLARLDDLASAASGCDAALRDFLRSFDQLERVSSAICRVTGTPSHEIVGALARRALCSALLSHKRIFELEQLTPAARTTFIDMAAAWGRAVRFWCHQRLGRPIQPKAAA